MSLIVEPVPVGARIYDSYPYSLGAETIANHSARALRSEKTGPRSRVVHAYPEGAAHLDDLAFSVGGSLAQAQAIKASGADGIFVYLGVINSSRLGYAFAAGLGVIPVTLADQWDPAEALASLSALGLSGCKGLTVPLDVEGPSTIAFGDAATMLKINAWAGPVIAAGFIAASYSAPPQPLSSAQLWSLKTSRYWKGMGSIRDLKNDLAEPHCGWAMTQMYPSVVRGGVLVDINVAGEDFLGRSFTWARQA